MSGDQGAFEFYSSDGKLIQLKAGDSRKMVGKWVDPQLYFGPGSGVRVLELDAADTGEDMKGKVVWDVKKQSEVAIGPDSDAESESDAPKEKEPHLCDEQQRVLDTILDGRNVFYTGSAGCGKSTLLRTFVPKLRKMKKQVDILCPTNLAALNVNGRTSWNYAGWKPDDLKKPLSRLVAESGRRDVWKRLNKTDVLVIDEISMFENLALERLNEVMKSARGQREKAFGGVQVVVTGDFFQLSPVRPFEYCIECGRALKPDQEFKTTEYKCENEDCSKDVYYAREKWAFRSAAWKECNFEYINLVQIHRQKDARFLTILDRIRRDGDINENHAQVLMSNKSKNTVDAIKLLSTRNEVQRINSQRIAALPSPATDFICLDDFDYKPIHRTTNPELKKLLEVLEDDEEGSQTTKNTILKALKDHRYDKTVTLKMEMRVVLQQNLEPDEGLVNGAQGTIVAFEKFTPERLPRRPNDPGAGWSNTIGSSHPKYAQAQIARYAEHNGSPNWPVVRFDNGKVRTIFPDCAINEYGDTRPSSLLARTQVPLMAGYAVTIHKAQGMTLEKVEVNLASAFDSAQLYVALSRAVSLEGLKVTALPRRTLDGTDPQVKEFFETYLQPKVSA